MYLAHHAPMTCRRQACPTHAEVTTLEFVRAAVADGWRERDIVLQVLVMLADGRPTEIGGVLYQLREAVR